MCSPVQISFCFQNSLDISHPYFIVVLLKIYLEAGHGDDACDFDGNTIRFLEQVPVKGKYEVTITFNRPINDDKEARKQKILKHAGTWDADMVKTMEEIVEERKNVTMNRKEYDFS